MEHDTSPNLFEFVHVHPLFVAVAHKSTMEVSPAVPKTYKLLHRLSDLLIR